MLLEVPEMNYLVPLGAATAGYFNLAVRQGWGTIVALANGVWAGALSIFFACVLHTLIEVVRGLRTNVIQTFDNFMTEFSSTVEPLFEEFLDPPLLVVILGAAAVVGVVTEVLHWVLVRFRQKRAGGGTNS